MEKRSGAAFLGRPVIHRIAVISDTHGLLRPEAVQVLESAEGILHVGDFADEKIYERLKGMNRLMAVRGNCDGEWAEEIPGMVSFELFGKKICMVHNKKHLDGREQEADLIIYGHSHRYKVKEADGKIWLNPGSCGPARPGRAVTMAVAEFHTETGSIGIKKVELTSRGDHEESFRTPRPDFQSGNLREAVQMVVSDLEKGKPVEKIIKKRKLDREFTEQICQIYFTHPGIDVQGVLNRIEIAGK